MLAQQNYDVQFNKWLNYKLHTIKEQKRFMPVILNYFLPTKYKNIIKASGNGDKHF